MTRLFPEDRLVIATHNPGKLREIAELIAPFGVAAVSAGDLGLPEPEETGSDFVENAVLKARAAAEAAGLPALADDSGLEVAALDGAPGIYSARWGRAGAGLPHRHGAGRARAGRPGRPARRLRLRALPGLARRRGRELRGPLHRRPGLAAAGRPGLRLRSDLPARGPGHHLRRDGAGRQAPDRPSLPRLREAGAGWSSAIPMADGGTRAEAPDPGFGLYVHWPFLPVKVSLLRLQQPCPRIHRAAPLARGPAARAWSTPRTAAKGAGSPRSSSAAAPPSLMPPETAAAVIERAAALWRLDPEVEITLEANPTSAEGRCLPRLPVSRGQPPVARRPGAGGPGAARPGAPARRRRGPGRAAPGPGGLSPGVLLT